MPDFEQLGTIGIWTLLAFGFLCLVGLKGAGPMVLCILIMTVMAGYFASKGG